jgi:hypothetical protein
MPIFLTKWGPSIVLRKKSKRAKPGDIGRLKVDNDSWATLHYLGLHEILGDVVLVDPNLQDELGDLMFGCSLRSYIVFYLFSDFVKDGLIEIFDHLPPPRPVPLTTRSPQRIGLGGGPWKSWILIDSTGGRIFRDTLTADETDIPQRLIVSHATLLDRLRNKWQPGDEVVFDS